MRRGQEHWEDWDWEDTVDWTDGPDRTRAGGHGWTERQQRHVLSAARPLDGRHEEEEESPRQGDAEEGDRAAERLHHHHR